MKILNNKGFSLVEVLVSTLIVSAMTVSVFSLFIYSLNITADNKLRVAAIMIAEQKMEYIRNLPYDDVGNISGPVYGVIPNNETITSNGKFLVDTHVRYIDDDYDGTQGGTPDDSMENDYKLVRVRVSWDGPLGHKSISDFTNLSPHGVETNIGGGTLEISVFNASGTPINMADVHIENNNISPVLSLDAQTNASGILSIPGATTSVESFEITVTKGINYSTDYTSDRNATNVNPTKPHATVIENQKTEISFAIDLLSSLTIQTLTADIPHKWQVAKNSTDDQINSRIVFDNNGFVYNVWQDYRQTGKPKILAQKFNTTGTAQWPIDIVIANATDSVLPDIKVDSAGNLYAAWHDIDIGNEEVYILKLDSLDGSTIWGGSKITTATVNKDQENIRLTLLDKNPKATSTVVWQDNRSGNWDLYVQQFDYDNGDYVFDLGNPVSGIEIKVNDTTDSSNQVDPVIVSDSNDNFYIAWTDDRNGNLDIYWNKFNSDGVSLWGNTQLISNTANQYSPEISIDSSDNIYVVWTDERNGNPDIYTQKFDSSGAPLWGSEMRVNTDTGTTPQYLASLAIDSLDDIYYVWTDERNENKDIFGQKLNSSGVSYWTDGDVRANLDMGQTDEYNPYITINPVNDDPFVSWQSDQNGDLNIYMSKFGEITGEVIKTGIPVILHGEKRIGENPVIYKFDETYPNPTGTITIDNIEWDSYTATSTTNIIFTNPTIPFHIEPNTSQTLKIYVE